MIEYISFEEYCEQAGISVDDPDAESAYNGYKLRVDMWNQAKERKSKEQKSTSE